MTNLQVIGFLLMIFGGGLVVIAILFWLLGRMK